MADETTTEMSELELALKLYEMQIIELEALIRLSDVVPGVFLNNITGCVKDIEYSRSKLLDRLVNDPEPEGEDDGTEESESD